LITLGAEAARAPNRPAARSIVSRVAGDSDAQLTEAVRRMRTGDSLNESAHRVPAVAAEIPGVTSAATMELLRRAVREDQLVWLGMAEADGTATTHEIHPISLAAGIVRGYERGRDGLVAYPVHRITAVRLVADDD
jgi:predicted DNA-binding transcriptional regulator YafY